MAESKLFTLAETGESNKGPIPFSESIAETISSAENAHNRDGKLSGISSGLKSMDELLGGLHKSDLIIIAGRPSMGKTALATNIAFQAAKKYENENDDGILFCSLEMSSIQLTNRILAEEAKISSEKIRRGQLSNDEFINKMRIIDENIFTDDLNKKIIMGISLYNQNQSSVADKIILTNLSGYDRICFFSYNSIKNKSNILNSIRLFYNKKENILGE